MRSSALHQRHQDSIWRIVEASIRHHYDCVTGSCFGRRGLDRFLHALARTRLPAVTHDRIYDRIRVQLLLRRDPSSSDWSQNANVRGGKGVRVGVLVESA